MADLQVGGIRATLGIDAKQWVAGLNESMRSLSYWEKSVGSSLNKFNRLVGERLASAGQAMLGFGAAVTAGLGGAVKVYADFDKAARQVNSIMRLSERDADVYRTQVRNLTRELGLNVDATQAMQGAYAVASSGFTDAAEQAKVLAAGLRLAVAGGADTKTTLDALTGALRAYGKGAEDAADFADILAKTVEIGQTEIADLAANLSRVTTTAANAGVSFDQVGSAIAAMTVKGAPTANVMDALNQAMLQMQAPGKDAQKVLAAVGLEADALGKTLRSQGLRAALVQVFQATGGRVDLLKPILGDVNAVKAAQALGSNGGAAMADAEAGMRDRAGTAQGQAAEITKAFSEQVGILVNSLKDLGISLAEGVVPALTQVNDILRGVVSWFQDLPEPVKRAAGELAALAAAASLVVGGLLTLAPSITSIIGFLGTGGMAAAVTAAKGAFASFSALLGPVALALAALTAAVTLVAVAWQNNWGNIQGITQEFVSEVQLVIADFVSWMQGEFGPILNKIRRDWDETWGPAAAEAMRFLGVVVGQVLGNMLRTVVFMMRAVAETVKLAWEGIKEATQTVWTIIGNIIEDAAGIVGGAIKVVTGVLQGDWKKAWDGLVEIVKSFGALIYDATIGALGEALKGLADFGGKFFSAGSRLASYFSDGFRQGLRSLGGVVDAERARNRAEADRVSRVGMDTSRPGSPYAGAMISNAWSAFQGDWADFRAGRGRYAPAPDKPDSPGRPDKPDSPGRPDVPFGGGDGSGSGKKTQLSAAERVVREVERRVGGFFEPGDPEQCANFVRDVYARAGVKLGVTSKPLDRGPRGAGLASSFAGTDVGQIITDPSQLRAGDVVTYANTYGNFERGAITHAGIYAGGGQIVHRPTRSGQVKRAGLNDPGQFAYGVRPYAVAGDNAMEQVMGDLQAFRQALAEVTRGLMPNEFARKRAEENQRFRELSLQGKASGASDAELAQVEAARRESIARINEEEVRANEDLTRTLLEKRLGVQASVSTQNRERIQADIAEEVAGLEELAQRFPARRQEISDTIVAIKASEAQRIRDLDNQAQAEQMQFLAEWGQRRQEQADAVFARKQRDLEFERTMGRATLDQQIAFLGEELANWTGSADKKRETTLALLDLYKQDLQERLQTQADFNILDIEQEAARLQARTDLTIAEQARLAAELDVLHQDRIAKHQEEEQMIQGLENSFQQFLVQTLSGQASFATTFQNLWKSIANVVIAELAKMIAKAIAFQVILKGLRSLFGGIFGGLFHAGGVVGGDVGGAIGAGVTAHTGGYLNSRGLLPSYHSGGLVNMGFGERLKSDEIAAKLQTGEVVLSRSQVAALRGSSGGSGVQVNVSPSMVQQVDPDRLGRIVGREVLWATQGVG